jgi:hypothetical protein
LEETTSVVKDTVPPLTVPLCVKIADEALLEPSNGDGSVVPASKVESGILTVKVFVEPDTLAAVALVNGYFGWEFGVAEERYKLASGLLVSENCLHGAELTCPFSSKSRIVYLLRIPSMSACQ